MASKLDASSRLRAIPAVEKVLQALGSMDLPRPAVVATVRRELTAIRAGRETLSFDAVVLRARAALERLRASRIQAVINGTGIIIHTNLGRAPLGVEAIAALTTIGANYNNLEYDLATGERGGRAHYLEHNLALLCEAEAATVVNNCAAALVIILRHFTARKPEVIISRGELIQIGGGFRIPDILQTSGAKLREVGTTNKTSLEDYAGAIGPETGLILKVHRSNFFMSGFVDSPSAAAIAGLARSKRVPFAEDLGSGAVLRDLKAAALEHEPTPRESLGAGVQLVCFSGDKLFGGPQAGIIAGQARLVSALKRAPFFRALRCDKLILAALQATTDLYLAESAHLPAAASIPVLAMLGTSNDALRARADSILAALQGLPLTARAGEGQSQLGGGTSPQSTIPSITIDVTPARMPVAELAARLRAAAPPVIGYIGGGKFKLDLRTIFPRQDEDLVRALRSVCSVPAPAREKGGAPGRLRGDP
ncbi:MAG: L-seryl-tRNA(Sec) selenium transferase [Verrucomicrobiota bacterium]|nr:L-seryl-tRNA(Sec) selenium transferase [Verrucomicrobiota bacterium]